MKKYQQLLIVSLGLVSFICFLIYKHEYDRLRNVLEVLEVFGSPQTPGGAVDGDQNAAAIRSHPLEINHNPALGAGSINELNLGGVGGNNAQLAYDARQDTAGNPALFDDTFVLKNGHGVRPPDNDEAVGDDLKKKIKGDVLQNQGSGEVVDNMADEVGGGGGGGGDGDGVIGGKFGALKTNKKAVQRLDSIFKEKHQQKEQDNEV